MVFDSLKCPFFNEKSVIFVPPYWGHTIVMKLFQFIPAYHGSFSWRKKDHRWFNFFRKLILTEFLSLSVLKPTRDSFLLVVSGHQNFVFTGFQGCLQSNFSSVKSESFQCYVCPSRWRCGSQFWWSWIGTKNWNWMLWGSFQGTMAADHSCCQTPLWSVPVSTKSKGEFLCLIYFPIFLLGLSPIFVFFSWPWPWA